MTFIEITPYACVSTAYLTESDWTLIENPAAPGHVANHDEAYGSYFNVPGSDSVNDEEWSARLGEYRELGFSGRFIEVLEAARSQSIHYVNFDADGGDIDGLERLH
jgi:hypothetical protein